MIHHQHNDMQADRAICGGRREVEKQRTGRVRRTGKEEEKRGEGGLN